MKDTIRIGIVARRDFVLGATAAAAVSSLIASAAKAQAPAPSSASALPLSPIPPPPQVTWEEAMRAQIGSVLPIPGRITFELPDTADNGNVVPFTVTVESPMTDDDFVKAVHIYSTANPKPDVASAYFSRSSGKAVFSSRMRLGRTQDVIAVAEMSDGKVYIAKRAVKVTIGGCGTG